MNYFLKLNIVSILYALLFFIPLELMLNVYRIARLTSWQIDTVNILTFIILLVDTIGGTLVIYYLTKKWMEGRKANFWTILLWFPYFILFIFVLANLIPITYGGDEPNPVTGLLALGGIIVYPGYIFFLNLFSITSVKQTDSPYEDSVK